MACINSFKGQNYTHLKFKCNSRNLFTDPIFKANNNSIFYRDFHDQSFRKIIDDMKIVWLRPKKICESLGLPYPKFEIGGFSRLDIKQGRIGNCWFIAGLNALTEQKVLLSQVVPSEQNFDDDYAGIFHFRFWQYGDWYDVVVDDYLPFSLTLNKLAFARNDTDQNEFWVSLVEKAYAKFYGSYQALDGGLTSKAILDMTGGIIEKKKLQLVKSYEYDHYWSIFLQIFNKRSMMGCNLPTNVSYQQNKESVQANKLVLFHAYTITKFATVEYGHTEQRIVRIKNPWASGIEWNGAWSDSSTEWNYVSEKDKKRIGFIVNADGEFWMSFEDFMKTWGTVEIVHLTCDCLLDEISKFKLSDITWKSLTDAAWKCTTLNFSHQRNRGNPGCYIQIENNEENLTDGFNTIIISMTQKESHLTSTVTKPCNKYFMFILYSIPDSENFDPQNSYMNIPRMKKVGISEFQTLKDSSGRFRVAPGNYFIQPFVDKVDDTETNFMLRIFSNDKTEASLIENLKGTLHYEMEPEVFSFSEITEIANCFQQIQMESYFQ